MPRQKLGLPVEPKGFGQNEGMKMKKSVHPASRKPEKGGLGKNGYPGGLKIRKGSPGKN